MSAELFFFYTALSLVCSRLYIGVCEFAPISQRSERDYKRETRKKLSNSYCKSAESGHLRATLLQPGERSWIACIRGLGIGKLVNFGVNNSKTVPPRPKLTNLHSYILLLPVLLLPRDGTVALDIRALNCTDLNLQRHHAVSLRKHGFLQVSCTNIWCKFSRPIQQESPQKKVFALRTTGLRSKKVVTVFEMISFG